MKITREHIKNFIALTEGSWNWQNIADMLNYGQLTPNDIAILLSGLLNTIDTVTFLSDLKKDLNDE